MQFSSECSSVSPPTTNPEEILCQSSEECGEGKVCVQGQCKANDITEWTCVESDGLPKICEDGVCYDNPVYNSPYVVSNTIGEFSSGLSKTTGLGIKNSKDECVDEHSVKEYLCKTDGSKDFEIKNCGEGEKCENGICIRERVLSPNEIAIQNAKEEYEKNRNNIHNFKPEYEQTSEDMTFIYLSLDLISGEQISILKNLPDYTQIKLFVESDEAKDYLVSNLPENIVSRINFIEVSSRSLSVWAQDYSEGDSEIQILPLTYLGGGDRKTPDNPGSESIYELEDEGIEIRKVPVEFGGGNLFIAKNNQNKKFLLIGADSYIETLATYQEIEQTISEEEFKDILKNSFYVDDVLIIGIRDSEGNLERQSSKIFHIDQAMLPLADGVIAMPEIIGNSDSEDFLEIKNQLEEYKQQLISEGFIIVTLKTTPDAIMQYQSYTNGIIYTDKNTGQKNYIMPIFPNAEGEFKLEGLNLENKQIFEREGIIVRTVDDFAYAYQGNIHCITMFAKGDCCEGVCPVGESLSKKGFVSRIKKVLVDFFT